ncbi:MAG: sulfatase-like hydrolase/transferase [Candidatus Lokiarchaeota archaeon]|nr:sulfatase-like hydrolase/transferase [Candidatus Lokiarchaeota archaeon]
MSSQKKRPNILFIMSDDHAFHAISSYTKNNPNRNLINETPNIDRIADEGMRFNNCFCTNSICTPSRASILTGKYSHENGVTTLSTMMNNKQLTFPKLLQKAGYQTGMVGKWHLGQGNKHKPTGFDYWIVLPGQGLYHNPIMIEMDVKKRIHGYVTDIITEKSINWLKSIDREKPFMLMCHHKAPHRPWEPDEKHKDMYKNEKIPIPQTFNDDYSNRAHAAAHAFMSIENALHAHDLKIMPPENIGFYEPIPMPDTIENYKIETDTGDIVTFTSNQDLKEFKYQRYIKDYLRCIAAVDDSVGEILKYLEEQKLIDDTIIIYTSDQGFFLGDHGWYDKRFMYEESLRMPFLIRYPKEIEPKTTNDAIILNVDFAETFLDYAGIKIPKKMQGRSFRSLLNDKKPKDWQDALYYRYWVNGTYHRVYAHYGIRTLKYKLIYYYCDPLRQKGARKDKHEPEWELFDLEEDPYEMNNVYNDPEYRDIVKNLKHKLHELQAKVGDKRYKKDKD